MRRFFAIALNDNMHPGPLPSDPEGAKIKVGSLQYAVNNLHHDHHNNHINHSSDNICSKLEEKQAAEERDNHGNPLNPVNQGSDN